MEFLNEQKLSIGQYRLIDNNNNKYRKNNYQYQSQYAGQTINMSIMTVYW